ncbi:bifunctional adenosylcobinamide kinase/adenosylcobinamide-phosphate guanylyltransferase [Afifella marina DSM 2698]|nr:bifunctional adenosylcobinamide kinase/adenosylcobinamide-phosphate guanylyltransferase [Afifella marina]MBK1624882.1 bifunctional adenosylcobinamide kinase/adenosylcobinamide-phosphate guanylyltransferase [Afifella marina DSM 2698]MBK1628476.1 bifunctional adenosylcobinamide kinase/adenosylcobinamide-phosphate guanylyltransferase [Afifella marina]MBK5917963.1 bifunctional adenosylcobinamide kinase/adenosylcobinamide-phosphate guanylyltransferase [Afifella marina]RAI18701.1 bifunctional aden
MITTALVLGGARSGKSTYAERLVEETGLNPVYVATCPPADDDAEMGERIAVHQARRGPAWRTVEEPIALADAIAREAAPDRALLVDCLTLWLSNILFAEEDIAVRTRELCAVLSVAKGPVVLVSNEVGLGIVPDNALARRFRDAQGRLNQEIARSAELVVFTAAGLPLALKGQLPS